MAPRVFGKRGARVRAERASVVVILNCSIIESKNNRSVVQMTRRIILSLASYNG